MSRLAMFWLQGTPPRKMRLHPYLATDFARQTAKLSNAKLQNIESSRAVEFLILFPYMPALPGIVVHFWSTSKR